jgi:hypothetical protein
MKQPPDEQHLHSKLYASKFSAEGFLGTDTRSLDEIQSADRSALKRTGVGKETLVARLKEIYLSARDASGASVCPLRGLSAVYHESMGKVPSPFIGDGVFEKGEVTVTEDDTCRTIVITALGINLIEKHDFYQGHGSRFRIDPELAVSLLHLRG